MFNPGIYDVAEYEDHYGPLLAYSDTQNAELVGFYYDIEGYKHSIVSVGQKVRQNPFKAFDATMKTERNYYLIVLREYNNWEEKWWREAIQNSVDAKARNIICQERDFDDDTVEIICEDDGTGMSVETFEHVFFSKGASTKRHDTGGVGGFGKAKELLVLPWIQWRMSSQDWEAVGHGEAVHVEEAETRRKGTKLSVLMPKSQCTNIAQAAGFIQKCYLPRVTFTLVNKENESQTMQAALKKGKPVRVLGENDATVYYNKKAEKQYKVYVRAKGILMFTKDASNVPGSIIIELDKPSIELLAVSRDNFLNSRLISSLDAFLYELASEQTQALRKKYGLVNIVFRGEEGVYVAERKASVLKDKLLDSVGYVSPTNGELDTQQMENILITIADAQEQKRLQAQAHKVLDFSTQPQAAEVLMKSIEFAGGNQVEAALAQFAWTPDFYLLNEYEGYTVPKKLRPEKMTAPLRKLAHFWAELCRFTMIMLNSKRTFGIGFVVSDDVQAQYARYEGTDWLMINPFRGGHFGGSMRRSLDDFDIFDISKKDQAEYIFSLAVHECTHMVNGLHYHDAEFAAFLTGNFADTYKGLQFLPAIKRAVLEIERETAKRLKTQRKTRNVRKHLTSGTFTTKLTGKEAVWVRNVLAWSESYGYSEYFAAEDNYIEGDKDDYKMFINNTLAFLARASEYDYASIQDAQKAPVILMSVIQKMSNKAGLRIQTEVEY